MCFFVEINLSRDELNKRFGVPVPKDPRYMPGYFHAAFAKPYIPVITSFNPEIVSFYQWGLIPLWVKDEETATKIQNSTFNARAESLWKKPSFRSAIKQKRCMVLSHGFFEWHTFSDGKKIPYYIRRTDNRPFAFAGLFDNWTNPKTGEIHNTFSIITTKANELLAEIHNTKKRMPVILSEKDEYEWLDRDLNKDEISKFMRDIESNELLAYPVSRKILNKNLNINDKSIIQKVNYPYNQNLF